MVKVYDVFLAIVGIVMVTITAMIVHIPIYLVTFIWALLKNDSELFTDIFVGLTHNYISIIGEYINLIKTGKIDFSHILG